MGSILDLQGEFACKKYLNAMFNLDGKSDLDIRKQFTASNMNKAVATIAARNHLTSEKQIIAWLNANLETSTSEIRKPMIRVYVLDAINIYLHGLTEQNPNASPTPEERKGSVNQF